MGDCYPRRLQLREAAIGPSKTVGLIAVVLLIILITGYALGEDGTAPTAEQISEQKR